MDTKTKFLTLVATVVFLCAHSVTSVAKDDNFSQSIAQ